jgi:hypothetical protein
MALPSLTYSEFVSKYYPGGGYEAGWLKGAYDKYMVRVSGGTPTEPTAAPTTTTPTYTGLTPEQIAYMEEQHPGVSLAGATPGYNPAAMTWAQYIQLLQAGGYPTTGLVEPGTTPTAAVTPPATAPVAAAEPATAYPGYETAPFFEAGEMLTAPMSSYEEQALKMLSDLAGKLGGMTSPWETAMGEQVSTALTSLLSGEFPEEYFRTAIEAPAQKRLEEVTLPGVREAYVGPGTFWGGERAEAERRAGTDVDMMLAAVRGDLGYQARQMALDTLAPAMEYLGLPAEQALQQMAGVGTFMGAGALPRLIEQHGLDIAYQEFIRTRPENQPYAQMLLSLLGIPMMGSYAPEQPESPLAPLANIFGSLIPLLMA